MALSKRHIFAAPPLRTITATRVRVAGLLLMMSSLDPDLKPTMAGTTRQCGRGRLGPFLGITPRRGEAPWLLPYFGSAAMVALALVCGVAIERFIGLQSVLLVFLMAIIGSAVVWGLLPSLCACILSVAAFNFFLLPPLYTFTIADPANAVAPFFFFIVAVIVSNLAAAARGQVMIARARERTTAALYSFSRKLTGIGILDDLLWATAYQTSSMLDVRTVLLMPGKDGAPAIVSGYPPDDEMDETDRAAAQACWATNGAAGAGTADRPEARRLFVPLRTGSGPLGVIGVCRDPPLASLSSDEARLLHALADQAAVAIERISLAGVVAEDRMLAETERLRAALLTSISHDLRTPLAAIVGAVSSLRSFPENYDAEQRDELLVTLQGEAERLNRFVANLLDMTRLESGAIALQADLFDVSEIVGAALRRAADVLAHHQVETDLEPELPMLSVDAVLLEQVLFNLLDNAAKYAPAGSCIRIRARHDGDTVVIEIGDEGPGIPTVDLERVFDKFYRVQAEDRRRAGTGLGLAICRGFVEAHGGRIAALKRDGGGALLRITLPVPEPHAAEAALQVAAHG